MGRHHGGRRLGSRDTGDVRGVSALTPGRCSPSDTAAPDDDTDDDGEDDQQEKPGHRDTHGYANDVVD